MLAACAGSAEQVKLLLDAGADVEAKDNEGRTAFTWAARGRAAVDGQASGNDVARLRALIDAGCEPPRAAEMLAKLDAKVLAQDATFCERLVAACEQRKQLGLLRPWLEARQAEGLPEGGPDAEVVKGALERIEKAAKAWW